MNPFRTISLFLLFIIVGPADVLAQATEGSTVVYLVRHAEKADDDPRDPTLTEAGQERARLLVHLLGDTRLTGLYTTDYKRTRDTIAPLSEKLNLEIEEYDPMALAGFAEKLRTTPGRYLISGHSNTTPELVRQLGGSPGTAIDEDEYDRLYVVVLTPDQPPVSMLLRYGVPFSAMPE